MSQSEVLFIDDDEMVIKALMRQLRGWAADNDIPLNYARTVTEAVHIIQNKHNEIGVIVSDQRMPEIDGSDFLKIIKKKYPAIVPVILSGQVNISDVNSLLEAGIFSFIPKPWNKEQLTEEIRKAMEVSVLRRQDEILQQKMKEEIQLAEVFQKTFLKLEPPQMDNIRMTTTYRPSSAFKVGGDFIDAVRLPGDRVLIIMGDISGHGLRPAFMSAIVKSMIHTEVHGFSRSEGFSPGEFMVFLNRRCVELFADFPDMFLALSVGVIDAEERMYTFASAGQPPVMCFRTGEVLVDASSDLVLGVDSEKIYSEHTLKLLPKDILFLVSDGLFPTGNRSKIETDEFLMILKDSKGMLMDHESLLKLMAKKQLIDLQDQEDDISILSLEIQ